MRGNLAKNMKMGVSLSTFGTVDCKTIKHTFHILTDLKCPLTMFISVYCISTSQENCHFSEGHYFHQCHFCFCHIK